MTSPDLAQLCADHQCVYDAATKDRVWLDQSATFRNFWDNRVIGGPPSPISDDDCDRIISILDRSAKGNTKDSEAVARAMVAQGAWRRMFNELHSNASLRSIVTDVLREESPDQRANLIDRLYTVNSKARNNLTGPSGNVVCAFLAAHDPLNNLSIISLNDRRTLIAFLRLSVALDWERTSIGKRIVASNTILIDGMHSMGVSGSARTLSRFCYFPPMKALWKGEHTVKRADKVVSVSVPDAVDAEEEQEPTIEDIRESMQVQALIAKIGTSMGFSIWLPKADRSRVLKAWAPKPGELLEELPLGYDPTTMKTIEQIDVIWLRKRSIIRAFEVEHTTSVYSGLLRMADLVALQPNINVKLHIVAPAAKHDKVMQEIKRPVFSLLEGRALSEMCTYLSYDSLKAIGEEKHLVHLSDSVIDDYEERAEKEDDLG